jgi:hypothetical protein
MFAKLDVVLYVLNQRELCFRTENEKHSGCTVARRRLGSRKSGSLQNSARHGSRKSVGPIVAALSTDKETANRMTYKTRAIHGFPSVSSLAILAEEVGISNGTWEQSMFGLKFDSERWTSPGTNVCSKESKVFTTPTNPAALSVWPTHVFAAPTISGLDGECEDRNTSEMP